MTIPSERIAPETNLERLAELVVVLSRRLTRVLPEDMPGTIEAALGCTSTTRSWPKARCARRSGGGLALVFVSHATPNAAATTAAPPAARRAAPNRGALRAGDEIDPAAAFTFAVKR